MKGRISTFVFLLGLLLAHPSQALVWSQNSFELAVGESPAYPLGYSGTFLSVEVAKGFDFSEVEWTLSYDSSVISINEVFLAGQGSYQVTNNTLIIEQQPFDLVPDGVFNIFEMILAIDVVAVGAGHTDLTLVSAIGTNNSQQLIDVLNVYGAPTSVTYNVTAVPVPAALWLFGSALLALVSGSRSKKVV